MSETKITEEKNRENRIALFEASVRELLELMANEPDVCEAAQPICEEVIVGDRIVQLQLHVIRDEREFMEAFHTQTVTTI